jgi:hypothetical protein
MRKVVPLDSRYIPLTQQKSCCLPTCLQILMMKHKIPLMPAEELGYHLGLIVHPDNAYLFYNVRTSKKKPSAGYGTRIYEPRFEPNKIFQKLHLPMSLIIKPISKFNSSKEVKDHLRSAEADDKDILLCFNHGALIDNASKNWGHFCVFDRLIGNKIRIIDPSPDQPKWRNVSINKMFNAMRKHGEKRSGGFWELSVENNFRP